MPIEVVEMSEEQVAEAFYELPIAIILEMMRQGTLADWGMMIMGWHRPEPS